jgi:hypothetical protein
MSQLVKGILGAAAITLAFGAVQFALGRDLSGGLQNPPSTPETAINRATKADRAAPSAGSAVVTKTISLRLDALSDTSVLVRIPVVKETREDVKEIREEARNTSAPRPVAKSPDRKKMTVACEPVVSVLTEVAKLLQPGRCVT